MKGILICTTLVIIGAIIGAIVQNNLKYTIGYIFGTIVTILVIHYFMKE